MTETLTRKAVSAISGSASPFVWRVQTVRTVSLAGLLGLICTLALLPGSASAATTDCFSNPSACGYPDPTNTGPTGTLTASGSITASTNGEVIEGKDISGQITVEANDVTIRNDKITATDSGSGSAGIWVQNEHTGTKVIDTSVSGKGSGASTLEAAIRAYSGVTVEGSNLQLCNECVQAWPLTVKNTFMKVSSIYSGAHAEDIYVCSGAVSVEHSTLINEQGQTATVFGDTICGGGNSFSVTNSLLAGGGYVLYPQANSSQATGTMTITGNRFARCKSASVYDPSGGDRTCQNGADSYGLFPEGGSYGLAAYYYSGSGDVWQDNVWDDNSEPVCADGTSGCGTAPPPTPVKAIWTTPTGAEVGVPVTLNGSASTGEAPLSCTWSFENQTGTTVFGTQSGCKVSHTFTTAGAQYVNLTVTDANGESNADRQTFAVSAASSPPPTPVKAIWTTPTGAEVGVPVTLNGSASTGEAPLSCTWSFENQTGTTVFGTQSGCKVSHTFTTAGAQYVNLTVTDANGESNADRQTFAVSAASSPPPTPVKAIWTTPTGAEVGVPVTLNGSASTGEAPLSCTWSFENQTGTTVFGTQSGCKVSHTFTTAGAQYVNLTVTDANGESNADRQTFAVSEASSPPPTPVKAIWTTPTGAEVGVPVTLNGSASTGEAPLSCTWSFENQTGTTVFGTQSGCKVSHTFTTAGAQYVNLTVTDANGESNADRQTFAVSEASSPPPTPVKAIWTTPTGAEVGVPVTLNGSASTGEAPLSCTWSFENESGSIVWETHNGCTIKFTFEQANTKYLKLTVTDANGESNSNRQSFAVSEASSAPSSPVKAIWTAPSGVEVGVPVTLNGSASTGEAPLSCTWSFENESGSIVWETHNGCTIKFTFEQANTKYLKLTVTDANGESNSNRQSFAVSEPASVNPSPSF